MACYSSTDLVHWTRQANALSRQASGDLAAGRIVERPKVLYNSATGKYVMWMHIDNTSYNDQRAGVAVSDTPCGPYTYLGATRPLGHPSRDLGLFKDDDGTAYMIHEDPAAGMRIERLSADYTSAQSTVATFPSLESPAMAKVGGRYFLLTSHLTGWAHQRQRLRHGDLARRAVERLQQLRAGRHPHLRLADIVPAAGHRQRRHQLRVRRRPVELRRT